MQSKYTLLLFFVTAISAVTAQNQQITLEEIWGGAFRTEGLQDLHSMNNGRQYSVLNTTGDSVSVDIYNYASQQKVQTVVSSNELEDIDSFSSYTFSDDESKLILATDVEPVYRRSRLGKYYVYDTKTKSLTAIHPEKIQEPTFSPDGTKVAFGYRNDLYVKDLFTELTIQITRDGAKNKIINGITDWVYEEEFGFVRAFEWNASSDKIAYLRFDETNVPEFSMDIYGKALYPTQQVFKYPKAGEANAKVTVFVFDLPSKKGSSVYLSNNSDIYVPRIKWTNDPNILSVQVMNRHQNDLNLVFYNAKTSERTVVLNEKSDTYIDVTDNLTFLADNSFIWTSEKDGYNHIYWYNSDGSLKDQVTRGPWEVTNYYGYDKTTNRIFYQSTQEGSTNRSVYSIGLDVKDSRKLTQEVGTNNATFSSDYSYFINNFSNTTTPPKYTLYNIKDGTYKVLKDNKDLASKLEDYKLPQKEFFELTTEKGHKLNAWMIKPTNFDASKKYPLFMYQYSGPGSQQVSNRWNGANDYWYYMLAEQGYIVACVDGRGTGFKGADFKKVTYKELGKYEVEDQIDAAKELGKRDYIDADRIGIWGWSYGGFMSSNCLLKGNDVFKMAIAVAPVTSWRFYDTIYTERYMQTPQENPSGYDENSPINHVEKLKGAYLLIHGTGDDNVHVQNTMRMVEALVQANKQFDWALYPDKNHGIYGGNTRLQLYTKMTNFIKDNL
ncbi:S9 family peptidase [Sungkyunkwania multivorans]|uniref:S9 family peptidase n=1 Tax=Sungkyunkwania multivorans TaxID=1173618 RepID=A0ABW3D1K7_9FLAO